MSNALERAYALLEDVTPLTTDCGAVCDGRCCHESADSEGMLLFPGEEVLLADTDFTIRPAEGGSLLTCGGTCDRTKRPLACRMFPLFPILTEEGRIKAVYDPRGYRMCPLVRECAHVPLDRDFVRAVRRAGRILMEDPACAAFLRMNSAEIADLNRLLKLEEERPPIARRRPR
jgi:hypothetical protein